ncbi:retrovirus-related pol polyprotein from transposon TNT 1-94 [Tanacetum coccineum]
MNDRVPSASKSSCIKNKEVEVEEHHRNLQLSKNKKHMSSECKHGKLDIRNEKSEVFVLMCKPMFNHSNQDISIVPPVTKKSKRASHPPKPVPNSKQRLHLLHMDLCGPMRIASINGKRYVLGDVYDYSRYTWVHFLRSKDEAPEVIKTFLKRITVLLQSPKGDIGFSLVVFILISQCLQSLQPNDKENHETMNVSFDEFSAMAFEKADVDELQTHQHVQHQPATIADNVPNAMFDENTFVNPFATPSTCDADSPSSQYVDPSNMHTFYQPYPHEFQWTKDHPLEQVIGEPSRPVLTRNQLRSDGDMCMYALTVSTVEPKNVKEAMTDPAWIESMQEELLQFKRLDVWVLVPPPDNIKPLTLKWLFKNKHDKKTWSSKTRLVWL